MKLTQDNVVLIVVALALTAVLWWQLSPANATLEPTPDAPIPEADIPLNAVPWYLANMPTAWQTMQPPIFNIMPRVSVGNGAGGARSYAAPGGCKSCGIPPGIRN